MENLKKKQQQQQQITTIFLSGLLMIILFSEIRKFISQSEFKVKSIQRSGTDQPSGQVFPEMWPLSNPNGTNII